MKRFQPNRLAAAAQRVLKAFPGVASMPRRQRDALVRLQVELDNEIESVASSHYRREYMLRNGIEARIPGYLQMPDAQKEPFRKWARKHLMLRR
jgi:hypothetical protein